MRGQGSVIAAITVGGRASSGMVAVVGTLQVAEQLEGMIWTMERQMSQARITERPRSPDLSGLKTGESLESFQGSLEQLKQLAGQA